MNRYSPSKLNDKNKVQSINQLLTIFVFIYFIFFRLSKFNLQKQKDKEEMGLLEKRLQEEKRTRFSLESQLMQEKKLRESQPGPGVNMPPLTPVSLVADTTTSKLANAAIESDASSARKKNKELENENKKLNEECRLKQDKINLLELELKSLAKYREAESRAEGLLVKLNLMQDKNNSLQESLSAETRFKMDLFSALGEARRQLEYANCKYIFAPCSIVIVAPKMPCQS